MLSREAVEIAFENFCYRKTLTQMGDRFRQADFWRAVNPDLSISLNPFAAPRAPYVIPPGEGERCRRALVDEGYFATPPIVVTDEAQRFRRGVERLAAAGYPTVFACLYDEFWRLFAGLESLMTPMLGERYVFVPEGLWAFFVPPGHSGRGKWGAASPHRDSLGPDPEVLAGRSPSLINLWIPLTDATPLSSCIYVVPAPLDPSFGTDVREAAVDKIDVQDIRALPAPAGAVLGWSTHLLHWGGRSSARASVPRVSVSLYLQRSDVPPFYRDLIEAGASVPFDQRLAWVAASMAVPETFPVTIATP